MSTKGDPLRLGLFVLAGTVLLVVGLYLLGNKRDLFSNTIEVQALFHQVGGLRPGNNVRYMGINVGTVKAVEIANDTTVRVVLAIRADEAEHINTNAVATVGSDGLMGNRLVNLTPGDRAGPSLSEGTTLSTSVPLDTDLMLRTLDRTNINLAVITDDLRLLSGRLNDPGNFVGMLTDTTLALALRQALYDLQASAGNAYALTTGVNALVLDAQHGQGALGVLISDEGTEADMRRMLADLRLAADTLGIAIGRIDRFSKDLEQGQGLAHAIVKDTVLANDVRRMIVRLDTSTALLNEDLRAIQRNWLLRRYFKEQEKAKGRSKAP